MAGPVISVRGLVKRYGSREVVRGIDLDVRAGEVFAILGPNGAGKTTVVEILEGYRTRTGGEVRVLGVDPAAPTRAWRQRVGIVLQSSRVQPELTVGETVALYAAYYPDARPVAEAIEVVGLAAEAGQRAGKLSGGQQRRLEVAVALVGRPDLLFLDEPTTGFDPGARRSAWGLIASLRDLGATVVLTTHYLEEAEALADRVAIIVDGEVVATGAPGEIGPGGDGQGEIRFRLPAGARPPPGLSAVPRVDTGGGVRLPSADLIRDLHRLTGWALDRGIALERLSVRHPSLEDVYLDLTDRAPG
ncbi:MAG TPA: ABC transporter ATP-binding protein [Acidimicrobiales bacterium]|nr:ABC transporter ATP-binding protein [Acidimicrobiales bacterium]